VPGFEIPKKEALKRQNGKINYITTNKRIQKQGYNSMTNKDKNKELKLKDAVQLYRKEEKAPTNSYNWYRESAHQEGRVRISSTNVPAYKKKGIWYVNAKEFAKAIKHHRESVKHLKQVTADYDKGIIYGKNGETTRTEWGGYTIHGNFRFVWSDCERYRKKSDGHWCCNKCNLPAERDYPLSKVYCSKCGASL